MTEPAPPPLPSGVDGCYRHPDRLTGIRCTRCNRPICPECMVAAPVGFQCPECVAGAAARTRQATTPAGGAIISRPAVTYTLIGINVAIFLIGLSGVAIDANDWSMWPYGIAVEGQWWLLLTYAFLHGGWLHIAFNMYVLFALGPTLERILGHGRYLTLYLLAALGGGVASYAFSGAPPWGGTVGASGAIFGLMGALVVAGRRLRYDITQVLILLGINVVIGFVSPGVDWKAHLGGMITGAVVAAILVYAPRRHRTAIQVTGLLAVVFALAAIVAWRTAQINDLLAPLGDFTV